MPNFKMALKTTVLYLLCVLLILVCFLEVYFQGENHYYINRHERAELAGTVDCAVIGASHARHGIDTRILDEELSVNSFNFSGSAMPTTARIHMMKQELARNPVKLVILEVSPSIVTSSAETRSLEGSVRYLAQIDTRRERLAYFFSAFEPKLYFPALGFLLSEGIGDTRLLLTGKYTRYHSSAPSVSQNEETVYKGYSEYPLTTEPKDMTINYRKRYHTRPMNDILPDGAELMQELLDVCRASGAEVIMVNMPVSKSRLCRYDRMNTVHLWYRDLAERNQVTYFDLNLLTDRDEYLSDTDSFIDSEHMTNDTQHIVTGKLCDLILRVRDGEDISSLFYPDYEAFEKAQGWIS